MMRKVLAIILVSVMLIAAGCSQRGTSSADLKNKGFTELQTYKEDEAQVTVYTGMVSAKDAQDTFSKWAKDGGWKERTDEFSYFAGYSGMLFEKSKEIMMINIVDAGQSTTVMVMIVPEDASAQSTPRTTTTKTESDKLVFHQFDSLFELSDTFKEVTCILMEQAFEYEFMGRETIDGVVTEHIIISTNVFGEDHALIEVWIDEFNTKAYKAIFNGEEVPDEQASDLLIFVGYLDFFFGGEYVWDSTWDDAKKATTTTDLGAGRLEVEVYEIEYDELDLLQLFEIVEVRGKYVLISYFAFEGEIDDKEDADGWMITRLIPR